MELEIRLIPYDLFIQNFAVIQLIVRCGLGLAKLFSTAVKASLKLTPNQEASIVCASIRMGIASNEASSIFS